MAPEDSITAVIPVHNCAGLLAKLLVTVNAQTVPFAEVLVVDNASTDGAAQTALDFGCRVIDMGGNTGFARAVNRGWREAATPWIAILNSDVELDARWLERLIANGQKASFLTGTILQIAHPGAIDGTYDLVSRSGCAWRAGSGEPAKLTGEPVAISIAPATACLFRRDVLEGMDGFDEGFESYLEDVDLGLRCLRRGFQGLFVPGAVAWHRGSATLGRWNPRVVRLISRNQLLLVARHYDKALFRSCLRQIVTGQLLWGFLAIRHGAGFAWLGGKFNALRNFRLEGEPCPALHEFLAASEAEIRRRAPGGYWRWYFRLTASAAR